MRHIPFILLATVFSLQACTQNVPSGTQAGRASNIQPINTQAFHRWLGEFEKDALTQGISQATLDDAFSDTKPINRIIELDRKQPESVLTKEEYLDKVVNDARIRLGQEKFAEYHDLLTRIGNDYGVQPQFIVALWGIETNFGSNTGNYRTVDALATLAYDGRRADYFRGELVKALQIIQSEHMGADGLIGSWAGALGQCQFMPTSFMQYAVDYDHDGKRDIWFSEADVFASIANYLHSEGWDGNSGARDDSNNYKVILKWNRSRNFATAVAMLAGRIAQ